MAIKLNESSAAEMRSAMIDCQLRPTDVSDTGVIAAMGAVARENFVPAALASVAYMDRPIALGEGRFLNAPLVCGRILTKAAVVPGERAMLIGAGSGYMAALLAEMGADVVAVEENAALAASAPEEARSDAIRWVSAPLTEGAADHAPYQLIIIDGAVDALPDAIEDQLAEGGRLIGALRDGAVSRLVYGVKINGTLTLHRFADMDVALLPGFAAPKAFQF